MGRDVPSLPVDFIDLAVVVGFQLVRGEIGFVHGGGVAHHGVVVGHLLEFTEPFEGLFVFLPVGLLFLLDGFELAFGFLVVEQDMLLDLEEQGV